MNGGFNFKVIGLIKEFCIHRFIDSHTAFDEKNIYSLKTAILHKSVSILHNIDCSLAKNTSNFLHFYKISLGLDK